MEEISRKNENPTISTVSREDSQRFDKCLDETHSQLGEILELIKKIAKNRHHDQFNTEKGISLLDVKNNLMLNYLIDLSYLIATKLNQKSIKDDPAVERLAETRVVFEKIRPIEVKLKYQIDKLIKLLTTHDANDADPLRFKPRLENFEDDDDVSNDEEAESGDDENESKKTGVYVPPKIMAMPYDDDDKEQIALERAKKRALSSSLVRELHEQYSETPDEIKEHSDNRRRKQLEDMKKRTEYEEDNMMRIQLTKKQRLAERRLNTDSTLNNLLSFGDYNVEEIVNRKKTTQKGGKDRGKLKGKKSKWKKKK